MKQYQLRHRTCEAIKITKEHFSRPDCFGGILEYLYPSEGEPVARIVGTSIDIPEGDYLVKHRGGQYGMSRADFFEDSWEPLITTDSVIKSASEQIALWPAWKQALAKKWLENPSTNKVAREPLTRNNEW